MVLALPLQIMQLLVQVFLLPLVLLHLPQNGIFLVVLCGLSASGGGECGHWWGGAYLDVLLLVRIHAHLLAVLVLQQALATGDDLIGVEHERAFAVLHLYRQIRWRERSRLALGEGHERRRLEFGAGMRG